MGQKSRSNTTIGLVISEYFGGVIMDFFSLLKNKFKPGNGTIPKSQEDEIINLIQRSNNSDPRV